MVARNDHVILWVVCLAVCASGCRSAPSLASPASADITQSRAQNADTSGYDGWLFKQATGRGDAQPVAERSRSANAMPGGAQQASATEAAPADSKEASGPGPKETVVTAATLAAASKPAPKRNDEDEDGGLDLSGFAPSNVFKKFKDMAGYGPDERIARAAYDEGKRLFREKKYYDAAKQFAKAADRWPDTPLEEDAMFWRAESLFFDDRYSAAESAYDALLKKYTYSHYLDTAVKRQFLIGRYWEQFDAAEPHWPVTPNFTDNARPLFDTWGRAQKAYEHVRMNDPTGPLADHALMAGANAYFVAGRYEDAAINYDMLRKEYPKSQHQKNAHMLGIESKHRMYQGPIYDGTPLKEASELVDQTLVTFGPTLGSDRERLIDAKNRMIAEQAERDWTIGQYYEKNRYYGAARHYYTNLIEAYPQTPAADRAKQRLEVIKDYPAEPPDRLAWLTGLLGPVRKR